MYAAANQPDRRVLNVPAAHPCGPQHAHRDRTPVSYRELGIRTDRDRERRAQRGEVDTAERTYRTDSPGPTRGRHRRRRRRVALAAGRSFTVQLTAKRGTAARSTAFRKAADMKPNWIVAGELVRRDGPAFFETSLPGTAGLATVESPDPEMTLTDWLSMSRAIADHLKAVKPLFVHMERDPGRPTPRGGDWSRPRWTGRSPSSLRAARPDGRRTGPGRGPLAQEGAIRYPPLFPSAKSPQPASSRIRPPARAPWPAWSRGRPRATT